MTEEMVDDKVARLLAVARRVGALSQAPAADGRADGNGAAVGAPTLVPATLLRRAVAASFVLLHNDGAVLPVDRAGIRRVAVIGPNALHPVIQGGGSARVIPASAPAPVRALREAFGGEVSVTTAPGCWTWQGVPEPPPGLVTDPVTGHPGVRLEFSTAAGAVFASEHRTATALAWWDGLPPGVGWGESGVITLRAAFRAETGGPYLFGAAGVGLLTITVNGTVAARGETRVPADPVETMTRPGEIRGEVTLAEGEQATVSVEFRPAAEGDCPVLHALPRDGRLDYAEGLLIGYRGYDAAGITPMFPFGHGLGYTSWDYESAEGPAATLAPGADAEVRVRVRNTGARPGREVVQAYITGAPGSGGRPVRVLGAFSGVTAPPGETAEVTLRLPARVFAVFDEETGRWSWPKGEFTVQVGRSSRDLRLSLAVRSG